LIPKYETLLKRARNKDLTVLLAICCFNSFVFNLMGNFILLYYILTLVKTFCIIERHG